MSVYFLVLVFSVVLLFLAQQTKKVGILSSVFFFITVLLLVTFAGVRDYSVGTDTGNYQDMFVYKKNAKISLLTLFSGLEPGFAIFQAMMQRFTENFVVYLFSIAGFVVGIYLYVIRKLSSSYAISIFVFISLGTYLFFFNGARQSMAAAIVALAFFPFLKGQFVRYVMLICLAITFHKTAIIMIPMYFVFRMKFSFRQLALLTVFTLVLTSGLSLVMAVAPGLVSDKLADYHNRTAGGGKILMVVYTAMSVFFYGVRKYISAENKQKYDLYLNLSIFNTLIYLMVNMLGQDVNMIRFTLYAAPGYFLIWPMILKEVKVFRSIVPWSFFVFSHMLFFYIYISKMIGPYKTNPILF